MYFFVLNVGVCKLSRKVSGRLLFEAIEFEYDNTPNLMLDKILQPSPKPHINKVLPLIKDDSTKWKYIRPLATVQDIEEGLNILRTENDKFKREDFEYPFNMLTIFAANCRVCATVCKDANADCPTWLKLKIIQMCAQEISTVLNMSYEDAIKVIQKEVQWNDNQ